MSGAKLPGDLHLGRNLVYGDNGVGPGEGSALEDIEADAAAAIYGDTFAGTDLGRVGHGTNTGGHGASYECSDI